MQVIVSKSNIEPIITALIEQCEEKIKSNKITIANTKLSNTLDININGVGNKILSNNGTYKAYDKTKIDNLIEEFNKISSVLTISKEDNHYIIKFPEYNDMESVTSKIITNGNGNKVMLDNNEYVDLATFNEMSDNEVDTMINELMGGE